MCHLLCKRSAGKCRISQLPILVTISIPQKLPNRGKMQDLSRGEQYLGELQIFLLDSQFFLTIVSVVTEVDSQFYFQVLIDWAHDFFLPNLSMQKQHSLICPFPLTLQFGMVQLLEIHWFFLSRHDDIVTYGLLLLSAS